MSTKYRLSLPHTKLSLRVNAAKHESGIQKIANIEQHYCWQKERNINRKFVLHDGPPYANGEAHMGHVLNRVLKDIINKYKAMTGHCVHYRPGWDCHGLPIELKVFHDTPSSNISPLEVRRKARKFAEKAIKQQMSSFKRWGLMADWENPYTTLDKQYEANQIGVFYEMYKKVGNHPYRCYSV
jgi:isoleucyl-tRNA synthetase